MSGDLIWGILLLYTFLKLQSALGINNVHTCLHIFSVDTCFRCNPGLRHFGNIPNVTWRDYAINHIHLLNTNCFVDCDYFNLCNLLIKSIRLDFYCSSIFQCSCSVLLFLCTIQRSITFSEIQKSLTLDIIETYFIHNMSTLRAKHSYTVFECLFKST